MVSVEGASTRSPTDPAGNTRPSETVWKLTSYKLGKEHKAAFVWADSWVRRPPPKMPRIRKPQDTGVWGVQRQDLVKGPKTPAA